MSIGDRIKEARIKACLTQSELANKLGIPYQSISQWERNLRKPKYETIQKISDALGVDLDSILEPGIYETNWGTEIVLTDDEHSKIRDRLVLCLASFSSSHPAFFSFLNSEGVSLEIEENYIYAVRNKDGLKKQINYTDLEKIYNSICAKLSDEVKFYFGFNLNAETPSQEASSAPPPADE